MSLQTRLAALVAAIGADIKDLKQPIGFRWYRATATGALNRGTPIPWDARSYDYRPDAQIALPASLYTLPVTGLWHFDFRIASFAAVSSAGWWYMSELVRNSTSVARGQLVTTESSSAYQLWQSLGSADIACNAGDTVYLDFNTASAFAMPVDAGADVSFFSGHLVCRL